MHNKLKRLHKKESKQFELNNVQKAFAIDDENWERIQRIWNGSIEMWLQEIHTQDRRFGAGIENGL
jgi:hypothetical protein